MSDLISREDAIDELHHLIPYKKYHRGEWVYLLQKKEVFNALNSLPSSEAKTKCIAQIKVDTEEIVRRIKEEYDITDGWIPCGERLPSERQDVYVTVLWDDYGDYITAYGMRTQFGWNLYSNAEGELIKGYTVVAWMPLPTPYRKENEE